MSQREDLLRGARQCIAEKGYGRTTARDITAASGANLASIGYYFGSKEALLNAAVLEAVDDWGDAVEAATRYVENDAPPLARFERFFESYFSSLPRERGLLVSSLQAMAQSEYVPEVRQQIATSHESGRRSLAAVVLGVEPHDVGDEDLPLGAVVMALLNGCSLQWYIAPETLPSAAELAAAMVTLTQP